MATMAHRIVGDVVLVVHGTTSPSDAEFHRYVEDTLAACADKQRPFVRQLVITAGARPTLRQVRWVVKRVVGESAAAIRVPVAVMTNSALIRATFAVVRGDFNVRMFPCRDTVDALRWLEIDAVSALAIAQALPELNALVGDCTVMDDILWALERLIDSDAFARKLHRERNSIAAELERGLGDELSTLEEGLQTLLERAEGAERDELGALAARIQLAGDELKNVVWALEAEDRSWGDVTRHVHASMQQLFDTRCTTQLSGDMARMISSDTAVHVLRIAQEGVRNAVLHAAAEHIELRLDCSDDQLSLEVRDDGCGIPSEQGKRGYGGVHHIRSRAEQLGGTATLETGDSGTTWRIILPLNS